MKIQIITIGKKHNEEVIRGIAEYEKRLTKYTDFTWQIIPSSDLKKETIAILKNLKADDVVILLDDQGQQFSSEKFSATINKEMSSGAKRLVFIIGGAYGVGEEVEARANIVWSLGLLTFPHQLVRLLLTEQIYRAFTIIKGEKYHHG
jgi:23S rRNA (pseudouridine1915-N3)-methyltransferase